MERWKKNLKEDLEEVTAYRTYREGEKSKLID